MFMLTIIKLIDGLPVVELMFFRSLLAFLPLAIYLVIRGQFRNSIPTTRPFGHLVRAILSLTTMGMTFISVQALPLPEAVTLQYTQPLFVVVLSALLLGETVRIFRWGAVSIGFLGALVITWPKLTLLAGGNVSLLSQAELIGALAALAAAVAYALNVLMVRQLTTTESSITISLWLGIYGSVLLSFALPFVWVMPSPTQFGLLSIVGLLGGGILIALAESLRAAPPSTTAPFEYSSLVFAIGLGFIVFGEVPDENTLVGGAILIAAGIAIFRRERLLMVRYTSAKYKHKGETG